MRFSVPHEMVEKAAKKYQLAIRQSKSKHGGLERPRRVVTISREFGAGGRQVAQVLGQTLDWNVWDKQIMEVLAYESKGIFEQTMFQELDEKVQGEIEALVQSLLGRTEKHTYFYLLPKAIYTIAQHDAIILGRGAHLLLPQALKVHLRASFDTRVKNLMRLYNLSEIEARNEVNRTQKEREVFMREMVRRVSLVPAGEEAPEFDLEINTDHFTFSETAEMILLAASKRFRMPMPELQA